MQFIFEQEDIFWDEVCYEPQKYPNCTISGPQISCPDGKPVCEKQYSEFSSIFIWFTLSSSLSVLIFVPLQKKFGNFVSRVCLNAGTTFGLILLPGIWNCVLTFCWIIKSSFYRPQRAFFRFFGEIWQYVLSTAGPFHICLWTQQTGRALNSNFNPSVHDTPKWRITVFKNGLHVTDTS